MSYLQEPNRKAVTVISLQVMRVTGKRIAMLMTYDSSFTALMSRSDTDVPLVGDSFGNVMQSQKAMLSITLDHIIYHIECVSCGIEKALFISDLPSGAYGTSEQALHNAVRVMQASTQMVKLEDGAWLAPTVRFLVEHGILVCTYIGLTLQSMHVFSGFRVQGRGGETAA